MSTVRKGVLPPITIAAGKKRGHPITTISHMESFGFVPDDLAKDFQKAFSSSCRCVGAQRIQEWGAGTM